MVSERTIYRLIDARIISAMNIDLPRKVRYSARKKSSSLKVDKSCRIGRNYDDFTTFMKEHPFFPVTQLIQLTLAFDLNIYIDWHFPQNDFFLYFFKILHKKDVKTNFMWYNFHISIYKEEAALWQKK